MTSPHAQTVRRTEEAFGSGVPNVRVAVRSAQPRTAAADCTGAERVRDVDRNGRRLLDSYARLPE